MQWQRQQQQTHSSFSEKIGFRSASVLAVSCAIFALAIDWLIFALLFFSFAIICQSRNFTTGAVICACVNCLLSFLPHGATNLVIRINNYMCGRRRRWRWRQWHGIMQTTIYRNVKPQSDTHTVSPTENENGTWVSEWVYVCAGFVVAILCNSNATYPHVGRWQSARRHVCTCVLRRNFLKLLLIHVRNWNRMVCESHS